jgi:metal-responsive CopG/Arc/MetJ family transcriptional regulator
MLPPMTQDSILHMRVSEDVKTLLDELRKLEPDLPSRSEMVRRLIERATAERKRGRK